MDRKVIGVYPISNCGEVRVYEVNNDGIVAGLNDDPPELCQLDFVVDDDDEIIAGFRLGGMFIPFRSVERIK